MTADVVDVVAARRFIEGLFGSAPAGSLVELRSRRGAGMRQAFHRVEAIDAVIGEIARSAAWTDVFVGVVARARRGGGRRDLVERASVLWVDCDTPAAAEALDAFCPAPSIVVASGIIRSARMQRGCRRAVRCWRHVVSETDWMPRGGGRDGR